MSNSVGSVPKHYNICSDIYYLGLSSDPPHMKVLVYGVYATELAQTILYSKMAFQEFAAGFGTFPALEDIGILWFAVPILTAIGVYHPFLGRCRSLAYKQISVVCGPSLLCIQNQNAHTIILHSDHCCFGKRKKFIFMHREWLVLICVVGFVRTSRWNCSRCDCSANLRLPWLPRPFDQKDTYINRCMYSKSPLSPFATL